MATSEELEKSARKDRVQAAREEEHAAKLKVRAETAEADAARRDLETKHRERVQAERNA